jgi:hypothetical protein
VRGQRHTPAALYPGKGPIVQEAGWAPGPVWTGTENLAPTGIRSLDCPSRIQSLYRLGYPAHSVRVELSENRIFRKFTAPWNVVWHVGQGVSDAYVNTRFGKIQWL